MAGIDSAETVYPAFGFLNGLKPDEGMRRPPPDAPAPPPFKDTSIVVTYLLNQGPNPTQGTSSAHLPDNKEPDVRSDSEVEEGETTSDSGADYDDDEEEWNDGEFDTDDEDGTSADDDSNADD